MSGAGANRQGAARAELRGLAVVKRKAFPVCLGSLVRLKSGSPIGVITSFPSYGWAAVLWLGLSREDILPCDALTPAVLE